MDRATDLGVPIGRARVKRRHLGWQEPPLRIVHTSAALFVLLH